MAVFFLLVGLEIKPAAGELSSSRQAALPSHRVGILALRFWREQSAPRPSGRDPVCLRPSGRAAGANVSGRASRMVFGDAARRQNG
jgi:hypothetical protein